MFIQIGGRISRGVKTAVCKEEREISGRISRYSFSFFSDFRILPSRERSANKEEEEEGEGSSVENGGGRILPRKSIFFVETSFRRGWFKRREAASLARKHVLTGCSLGSSWFFSCVEDIVLVVNGFYERGYSFPTRDRGDCVCTVSF